MECRSGGHFNEPVVWPAHKDHSVHQDPPSPFQTHSWIHRVPREFQCRRTGSSGNRLRWSPGSAEIKPLWSALTRRCEGENSHRLAGSNFPSTCAVISRPVGSPPSDRVTWSCVKISLIKGWYSHANTGKLLRLKNSTRLCGAARDPLLASCWPPRTSLFRPLVRRITRNQGPQRGWDSHWTFSSTLPETTQPPRFFQQWNKKTGKKGKC